MTSPGDFSVLAAVDAADRAAAAAAAAAAWSLPAADFGAKVRELVAVVALLQSEVGGVL